MEFFEKILDLPRSIEKKLNLNEFFLSYCQHLITQFKIVHNFLTMLFHRDRYSSWPAMSVHLTKMLKSFPSCLNGIGCLMIEYLKFEQNLSVSRWKINRSKWVKTKKKENYFNFAKIMQDIIGESGNKCNISFGLYIHFDSIIKKLLRERHQRKVTKKSRTSILLNNNTLNTNSCGL